MNFFEDKYSVQKSESDIANSQWKGFYCCSRACGAVTQLNVYNFNWYLHDVPLEITKKHATKIKTNSTHIKI